MSTNETPPERNSDRDEPEIEDFPLGDGGWIFFERAGSTGTWIQSDEIAEAQP